MLFGVATALLIEDFPGSTDKGKEGEGDSSSKLSIEALRILSHSRGIGRRSNASTLTHKIMTRIARTQLTAEHHLKQCMDQEMTSTWWDEITDWH